MPCAVFTAGGWLSSERESTAPHGSGWLHTQDSTKLMSTVNQTHWELTAASGALGLSPCTPIFLAGTSGTEAQTPAASSPCAFRGLSHLFRGTLARQEQSSRVLGLVKEALQGRSGGWRDTCTVGHDLKGTVDPTIQQLCRSAVPGQTPLTQLCPSSQSSLSWGSHAILAPVLKAVR